MTITTSGTTLTFNDATTQTTAPVNTSANVNSVSAGTGISVNQTTGALTVTNSGVTSIVAGTGISVSASTGGVTISASGGGVTSLNGQTGAITNTSTNTIGSYIVAYANGGGATYSYGSTISGSSLCYTTASSIPFTGVGQSNLSSLGYSGTWRAMARSVNGTPCCGSYTAYSNIWVRVS